jgi:hypothetical protein
MTFNNKEARHLRPVAMRLLVRVFLKLDNQAHPPLLTTMEVLPRLEMGHPMMVVRLPCGKSDYGYYLRNFAVLISFRRRMGELEPWIDENFVRNVWFQLGENVNVKMIRDKFSG